MYNQRSLGRCFRSCCGQLICINKLAQGCNRCQDRNPILCNSALFTSLAIIIISIIVGLSLFIYSLSIISSTYSSTISCNTGCFQYKEEINQKCCKNGTCISKQICRTNRQNIDIIIIVVLVILLLFFIALLILKIIDVRSRPIKRQKDQTPQNQNFIQRQLQSAKNIPGGGFTNQDCNKCFGSSTNITDMRIIKPLCSHSFHAICLGKNIQKYGFNCPICQQIIKLV